MVTGGSSGTLDKLNLKKDLLTAPGIFSGHKFRPYRVLVSSLKNWRSSDFFPAWPGKFGVMPFSAKVLGRSSGS